MTATTGKTAAARGGAGGHSGMNPHRRDWFAAERFAERRRREDEAPKLCNVVPTLTGLRIELEERSTVGGTKHIRRILVDRAPALFLVQCGDPRCVDGEHDLTMDVMRALRGGETAFHGSDECRGTIGSASCPRVLHFSATAEYKTGTVALSAR